MAVPDKDIIPTEAAQDVGSIEVAVEDVDLVPGTEIMADWVKGHEQVHADDQRHIVLVPQPSHDSADPLNWKRGWKLLVVSGSMFYTFFGAWICLSLNPFFFTLMTYFGRGVSDIAWLTSGLILCLGFGNFLVVPIAVCYGRRPAYLYSALTALATSLWAAAAKSYSSFLAARIMMGFANASIETLGLMTIVDTLFLHERGTWASIYFLALFAGATLGGVVSSVLADSHLGWHWFFWITSIFVGVSVVGILGLMPETAYNRGRTSSSQHEGSVLHKGKPPRSAFSVFPKRASGTISPLQALWRPFPCMMAPTILYSSVMFGLFACMYLVANLVQTTVFQTGYGFTNTQTGLTNLALLIGEIIGMPMSGWLSDWFSMRATRKNRMIREPEMRLVALIPTIFVTIVGLVIVGCTAEAKTHWMGPVMGFAVLGAGSVATCVVAINYGVDCNKELSGEVMLIGTVFKNTLAFGFANFSTDWVLNQGLRNPFLILMGVALFLGLVPSTLMYFYGKNIRRWTAKKAFLPKGAGILAE